MTDKPYNYASYELCLISEFVDVADTLNSGWVFRGHEDASWNLSSSLERETRLDTTDRTAYEANTLQQIKAATSFKESRGLDPKDDFSWLALLQHHGCKTRLVDFTESFYVALYFAVRGCPKTDAAVWAIPTSLLDSLIEVHLQVLKSELSLEEAHRGLVNNCIALPDRFNNSPAVVYGKPARLNQRLIAQQGLFLCPLNLDKSFMENLTVSLGLTGTKEEVQRLGTLDELKAEAMEALLSRIIAA